MYHLLRTRPTDVSLLTMAFLKAAGERLGKNLKASNPNLSKNSSNTIGPENVREMKNAIDRMVILYDGPVFARGLVGCPAQNHFPHSPSRLLASAGAASGDGRPVAFNRKQKLEMARQLFGIQRQRSHLGRGPARNPPDHTLPLAQDPQRFSGRALLRRVQGAGLAYHADGASPEISLPRRSVSLAPGLQPGENGQWRSRSRFNGFGAGSQTVETVRSGSTPFSTGLKPRC